MRVLLVEDSPSAVASIRNLLGQCSAGAPGFESVHAPTLAQALELLQQPDFDLVLLDLGLPDSASVETVARVKKARPTVPIVVMTGQDNEVVAADALRRGAQDYLVKGQFDGPMVARTIRHAIERKKIEAQLQTQVERQAALYEINRAITSTLDLRSVVDLLLEWIVRLFPSYAITLRLADPTTGDLEQFACRNLDEVAWRSLPTRATPRGMVQEVAASRKTLAIADVRNYPVRYPEFMREENLVSYLGVPLMLHGDFIGMMGIYSREKHLFGQEEIDFFNALGAQAAVALYNAQLYERLKDSNETLEKTLEAKSMLAGVMAHELKTPIQVILGSASMLADNLFGNLTQEQRERVRAIQAGGEELLALIDSTLQMARLEHGVTALAVTEVCVGVLAAELRVEFDGVLRGKGIELEIDAPPPGVIAMKTDRIKLKEILRNLIDNARKFTHQGKVTVRAVMTGQERLDFIVADTGIGIRNDLLPRIFESFYQVSASDKERASAGLGLSIVKRLVTALRGEIHVASEPGKGTTFRVSLPREIASAPADGGAAPGE